MVELDVEFVYAKLTSYQLKIACYKHKIFYISLRVITKQKPIIDIQTIKRKDLKAYHFRNPLEHRGRKQEK